MQCIAGMFKSYHSKLFKDFLVVQVYYMINYYLKYAFIDSLINYEIKKAKLVHFDVKTKRMISCPLPTNISLEILFLLTCLIVPKNTLTQSERKV